MFFYFSLMAFSIIPVYFSKFVRGTTGPAVFLVTVALSFVLGFRAESVGTDTPAYFRHLGYWVSGSDNTFSFEPGLYATFKVIDVLGVSHSYYFFVIAFLTMIFFSFGILRFCEKRIVPYVFLSFILVFYIQAFSGVRQILAVSIVFYALSLLDFEKGHKNYLSFIFMALACFFHNSALLVIPVVLAIFVWLSIKKTNIGVLLFSGFLFVLVGLMLAMIFNLYGNYFYSIAFSNGAGLALLPRLFLALVSLLIVFRVQGGAYRLGVLVFVFYLLGIIVSIPGYYIENLYRASYPFLVFEGIYYGRLMLFFPGFSSFLVASLVLFLNLFLFSVNIVFDGRGIVPYQFLVDGF